MHNPARETRSRDWKEIDEFFEAALKALENGDMTQDQYQKWVTHFVGLANNEGIDQVLKSVKDIMANKPIKWKP